MGISPVERNALTKRSPIPALPLASRPRSAASKEYVKIVSFLGTSDRYIRFDSV
jgi:hypothetical protein